LSERTSIAQAEKKDGHAEEALGRSKGGMTTKIHTAVDALGNPVRFILTPGQASDYKQGEALVKDFPAEHVLADKAYDGDDLIAAILATGARPVIPPKANRTAPRGCDYALYAERHRIECFFARLKQFRGLATRYCKLARNFAAFLYLAAALHWIL
jgi:transposase